MENEKINGEGLQNINEPTLQNDIDCRSKELAEQKAMREHDVVRYVLDQIVKECPDKSKELLTLLSNDKTTLKDVKLFVTNVIEQYVDGNMITPRYISNSKCEQEVLLYVGTHWETILPEMFKDFVKRSSIVMGLLPNYYEDPNFMKSLFDFVAFRFSKPLHKRYERGKVFINLKNGTIVLDTDGNVQLLEHQRSDGFTYVLPYVYDPNATCEKLHKFLNQMLPEKGAQDVLAEYLGYSLTTDIKVEKMLVLYGPGGNGKSVILDVIEAFFGKENVSYASLATITQDDKKRALINDKSLNISYESSGDVEPSMLKRIISGEKVEAYVNYVGPITMQRYAKLIASFNLLPKAENSYAYFRRIILMPFSVTISEKAKNVNLAKEIIATELPGIFNWVLEGLRRFLVSYSFTLSEVCETALEKYHLQSDSVKLFVTSCCEATEESVMKGDELYKEYCDFCISEGIYALKKRMFYQRLENAGVRTDERRRIKVVYVKMKPYEV